MYLTTSMQRSKSGYGEIVQFRSWMILFLLGILVMIQNSNAQDLSDSSVIQRIKFLQNSLHSDQQGTKLWWNGWLAGYGAGTIAQGAIWYSSDEKTLRQDMATGAATTLVGLIGQFISNFQPHSFADKFDQLPDENSSQRLNKMTQMSEFLTDRSQMEIEARKWKAHILPTSINLASGLVTWIGFHRTVWDGVANFALNCVISEAQIWSQPIRAKRELRRYHKRFDQGDLPVSSLREINYNFVVTTSGAGIRVQF